MNNALIKIFWINFFIIGGALLYDKWHYILRYIQQPDGEGFWVIVVIGIFIVLLKYWLIGTIFRRAIKDIKNL